MSDTPETKPTKGKDKSAPVFTYLAIMFAVAFLMLLLAYFIQQRNNDVAIDGLKDSISSSFASMDEVLEDNRQLREEIEALEQELETLRGQQEENLSAAAGTIADLEARLEQQELQLQNSEDVLTSWNDFYDVCALYEAEQYSECADLILQLCMGTYYMTPEAAAPHAREILDALAAAELLDPANPMLSVFVS